MAKTLAQRFSSWWEKAIARAPDEGHLMLAARNWVREHDPNAKMNIAKTAGTSVLSLEFTDQSDIGVVRINPG
jgi:hypothetical protein